MRNSCLVLTLNNKNITYENADEIRAKVIKEECFNSFAAYVLKRAHLGILKPYIYTSFCHKKYKNVIKMSKKLLFSKVNQRFAKSYFVTNKIPFYYKLNLSK